MDEDKKPVTGHPYAPPKVKVLDASDAIAPARPREVTIAVCLLCVLFAWKRLSIVHTWNRLGWRDEYAGRGSAAIWGLLLLAWIIGALWRRRNWARIAYCVWVPLGFATQRLLWQRADRRLTLGLSPP